MPELLRKTFLKATFGVLLSTSALFPLYAAETSEKTPTESQMTTSTTPDLPEITKSGPTQSFTLKNGLQVVVIENHRAPVVTQMIWYHVGSADEPKGHTGIAHFLEHLMFKGTANHKDGEFSKFIAKIGGEENAFTYYDYTGYYQSVASDYLQTIMEFEADRMENLVLTDEVIAPERNVIIEERRMRTDNNPDAMLAEETRATLFMNSPYHNPVIGWKQEMEKLTRDDAIAFYNKYYTPNNATLIISGDVTAEKVRELATEIYGKLPVRSQIGPRIRPQEPEKQTLRTVTMHDPRVTEPSFQKMWVVPSYHNAKDKKEAQALDLLGEILGGAPRGRLYQSLVVKTGSAASVGANYSGNAVDDGVFYLYGMPRGGASLEDVQEQIAHELTEIRKNGVTKSELDQARNRFIKNMIFSLDSPSGLAQIYGSSLSVGMTIEDVTEWPDRLKEVTTDDIKAVANRYLDPDKSVTSYLLPPASEGTSANINQSKKNK
ncbi:M16 family metallopeptidase [Bartonella apihabitans]|uniref:M16 family metallopeptidase n=1 Tax=Bartonella apihabitans TaxID=2750929 RepID=UPI0039978EE2